MQNTQPSYTIDSKFIEPIAKLTGLNPVEIDKDLLSHGHVTRSWCQHVTYRTLIASIDLAGYVAEFEEDPDLVSDQDFDPNYKLSTIAGELIRIGMGLLKINAVKTNKVAETEAAITQVATIVNKLTFK
jgi:hypothetical protein